MCEVIPSHLQTPEETYEGVGDIILVFAKEGRMKKCPVLDAIARPSDTHPYITSTRHLKANRSCDSAEVDSGIKSPHVPIPTFLPPSIFCVCLVFTSDKASTLPMCLLTCFLSRFTIAKAY